MLPTDTPHSSLAISMYKSSRTPSLRLRQLALGRTRRASRTLESAALQRPGRACDRRLRHP
eukprot:3594777-Prymnesium_polylepis.1